MKYSILFVLVILVALFNTHQSYAQSGPYDGRKTYVTIWFDHAFKDQKMAVDLMLKDNIKGALLVRTGVVGQPDYMSWDQLRYYSSRGFELIDHSITHPKISDYTSHARLTQEIVSSRSVITNHQLKVIGYISPYDYVTPQSAKIINQHYKWTVVPSTEQNTIKSIQSGGRPYGFTIPTLQHLGVGVPPGPPLNDFESAKAQIDYAINHNTWLILSFHQIDSAKIEYHTDANLFIKILDYIKQKQDARQLTTVTPSEGLGIQ